MKKVMTILLFMTATASAQDYCNPGQACTPRGFVKHWPEVERARCEASLCCREVTRLVFEDQLRLTYLTDSVRFQPYYSTRSAVSSVPAVAPPVPMVPASVSAPATMAPATVASPPTSLPYPALGRPR